MREQIMQRRRERKLKRKQKDIEKILDDVYSAKLEVTEEKIASEESQENIDNWCEDLDDDLNKYEGVLEQIKGVIESLHDEEEENRACRTYTEQKRIEVMKLELKKEMEQSSRASGESHNKSTRAKVTEAGDNKIRWNLH